MKQNTTPLFFCFSSKFPMWQTFKQNRITFGIVFCLLLYFAIMDVLLYKRVQQTQPILRRNTTTDNLTIFGSPTSYETDHWYYSPFEGLSVKMMMMDQPNDYVHIPLATLFNKVTYFSEIFVFITPNMISVVSIFVALLAAKFVTSEDLLHRQFGVLIFECRNFLDALDGVVFRARSHLFTFVTNNYSMGGMIDGLADVLGFSAFLVGCYIYLKKLSARKNHNQNGGLPELCETGGHYSKQPALKALASFSVQIVYGAFAWNVYMERFHNVLETPMPNAQSALFQNLILKSNYTWVFMWIWRFANAHGLIEILALFIFIDKLSEFVIFLENRGMLFLIGLTVFTHLYYNDVSTLLHAATV